MSESNEFYDVKISQDITNEKERNIITDSLIKNNKTICNSDYDNKYFFVLVVLVITIVLITGISLCFLI